MTRLQLEHVLRAAGAVTDLDDMVVIGSQAILGQFPDAPADLLKSMEVDLYPKDNPAMSIQIDGAIGEHSPFHETFGYYGHGVAEDTAVLPTNWETRLKLVKNENTRGVSGWCLEANDLAFSKLAAGREKDLFYVKSMVLNRMVGLELLAERIENSDLTQDLKKLLKDRLIRLRLK
jgi:hypothetical protein